MEESIQEQKTSDIAFPVFLTPLWKRNLYGAFIVIMAVLDFLFIEYLKPDWQSGRLQDYIALFLSHEATLLFFPLIAYSIVCFLLLIENQEQYASKFVIRLGIYTGAFLALQYSIVTILAVNNTSLSSILPSLLIGAFPLILKKVYQWLSARLSQVLIRKLGLGISFVIILIMMIVQRDVFSPFFTLLIFVGFAAPFWSFLISGQTALWLLRNHESKFTIFRGLGIIAWLAAYIGALRFDILKMYELYAALPPTPPDCYIATAAAQGHPQIVGSQPVHLKSGTVIKVNTQLQHFKIFEIAMMAVFPKLHHLIRKIYDVVGRNLATYIENPLLADVAFMLLLPVEWISFRILKLFIPEIEMISKKIYHS